MPAQAAAVNTDTNGKSTSAYFANRGDGTSNWHHVTRTHDGGDVAQGAVADAAVTNPASSGSVVALLKGILTFLRVSAAGLGKAEDAAHVTGDTGVMALGVRRDAAAASSGATGDYEPLQTDATGRLRTVARRDPTDTLSFVANVALRDDLVVKAAAGVLHSIVGAVISGEDGYIQVHDSATQPADTAVPELSYFVGAASDPQPVNIPLPGHVCTTGITLVWSSTAATLTAGTAKLFLTAYFE